MPDSPLSILYQDEHFVAVNKPRNLLVHRTAIDRHETQFLLQRLRDQLGQHLYPVHRLDKPTSGIVLFAFSPEVAALLQKQMVDNTARKIYLLVCRGYCDQSGEINHALKPLKDSRKRTGNDTIAVAQEALTHYQRLATVELDIPVDRYPRSRYSLVQAQIFTGRRHQIRRHFKHISHPIIGCPKYGKSVHNRFFAEHLGTPGLLLHAWQLHLQHPCVGQWVKLEAEPPASFTGLLVHFNWVLP